MIRQFELIKNSKEIKNEEKITIGCTLLQNTAYPEVIGIYKQKEKAINKLKTLNTEIKKINNYWIVEEYYVEENIYNDDGEFISQIGIHEFSKTKNCEYCGDYELELVNVENFKLCKVCAGDRDIIDHMQKIIEERDYYNFVRELED